MTPAARVNAAIEILAALDVTNLPADRFLRHWWAARRYAGSKDRAAVTERVYRVLRRRASLAWRMASESPRALVLASLLAEGVCEPEIAALFDGSAYGPSPLDEAERAALTRAPPPAPDSVRDDYPAWLAPELERALGDRLHEEMRAMLARAPVDLRVNSLKASRDELRVGLKGLGIAAEPTPYAPAGLRIATAEGLSALRQTAFFQTGAFEVQDEGSQIIALLCAPKPGQRVLDLAAGAGGKSLAFAALMDNHGAIVASEGDAARLKPLGPRAWRAGATIIQLQLREKGEPEGLFDVVLVDAPCSGSGTWRRSPEQKWRLTPERLQALQAVQSELLRAAARFVTPGGRLVYAVCSLLPCEGADQVETFRREVEGFAVCDAVTVWRRAVPGAPCPAGLAQDFRATPWRTGTDGFYAAVMERTGNPKSAFVLPAGGD